MRSEATESKPYIRRATRGDCLYLAEHLRREDREEIGHALGINPQYAVLIGFKTDYETHAVIRDGRVVAIIGVGGVPGVIGFPWMLATDELSTIRKTFLRGCNDLLQDILTRFPRLENYVWPKNEAHVQWLRWLGFKFDPAIPYGINDEPFQRFYMKDEICADQQSP